MGELVCVVIKQTFCSTNKPNILHLPCLNDTLPLSASPPPPMSVCLFISQQDYGEKVLNQIAAHLVQGWVMAH